MGKVSYLPHYLTLDKTFIKPIFEDDIKNVNKNNDDMKNLGNFINENAPVQSKNLIFENGGVYKVDKEKEDLKSAIYKIFIKEMNKWMSAYNVHPCFESKLLNDKFFLFIMTNKRYADLFDRFYKDGEDVNVFIESENKELSKIELCNFMTDFIEFQRTFPKYVEYDIYDVRKSVQEITENTNRIICVDNSELNTEYLKKYNLSINRLKDYLD